MCVRTHILFLCFSLLTAACTGEFRNLNDDRAGVSDDDLAADYNDLGYRLGIVQQGIYFNYDFGKGRNWPFQLTQNLNADLFAGYMHDPKPLLGGSHNSDYNLQDGWNGAMWEFTYSYILPEIYRLEHAATLTPPFRAVTKILKVLVMHRVTDFYGPIIYSRFAAASDSALPDKQEEVYTLFFADLDEACDLLAAYIAENPAAREFARFDILLDGQYTSWLRLANSLRMRLAMRIATADPEKGRAEYRKAATGPCGVIEENRGNAAVAISSTYTNPLGEINRTWREAIMNASMESILTGYADPRLPKYFEPCPADLVWQPSEAAEPTVLPIRGQYRGIRQGTCFAHPSYAALSCLALDRTTPPVLLSAAEVWFLRAEAALRGWSEEAPGDCYRTGVRRSFEQRQAEGVDAYLASDRMAADYHDVLDAANDIAARCRVTPRWDETADAETKLERIITQKWIALFPEGCEAWAEQRRTGYPRLFPVRYNHSRHGSIDTEIMIRRLPFPGDLSTANPTLYNALLDRLTGLDNGGTRLWWDTGHNF